MTTIPLTRSKHLIPFANFMRRNGEQVEHLVQKSRLPSSCLDDPNMLVPSDAAFHFRELAARVTGLPNISLESTKSLAISDLGDFGQKLLQAPTLSKCLTEFCRLAPSQTSMASFELKLQNNGDASFCYHFNYCSEFDMWHDDLYILQWTIKLVRLVDPTWAPKALWLSSPDSARSNEAFEMLSIPSAVSFGHHCTGFSISSSKLAMQLKKETAKQKENGLSKTDLQSSVPAITYPKALRQMIRSYAADRWLSVEEASECVGESVRTLQRRLSAGQTTYSSVLEQTRSEMASALLEDTEATVFQISSQLGYKSPGNFTRAFRRWSGVSPSEFRRNRRHSIDSDICRVRITKSTYNKH